MPATLAARDADPAGYNAWLESSCMTIAGRETSTEARRGSAPLDGSSVEMYTGLLLRCAALDASAHWTRRVTDMRIHGSWLGTCSEIAAFTNLRSLALVGCRCHTVAGLDELDLDSLAVDALAFYARHRCGRYVGPVVDVGTDYLAPLLRARRLVVRHTPALATMVALS